MSFGLLSGATLRASAGVTKRLTNGAIYVDKSLVVINKRSGLVSQNSENEDDPMRAVMAQIREKYGYKEQLHTVHRLDKLTTGCLLLATSSRSAREISRQFRQGDIEKTYLALVNGTPQDVEGIIRAPLEISESGRVTLSRAKDAKEHITEWSVLHSSKRHALLRLKLVTGHKHQIRVHLSRCLGVPVVGDDLYGKAPSHDVPPNTLCLHSSHTAMTRFRSTGGHKRFRLGVQAPPPESFMLACGSLKVHVPEEYTRGAVFIDGLQSERGDVPGIDGRWVEGH